MSHYQSWTTDHGDTVEVYLDGDGDYRWRVRAAGNNEIVGSGEGHPNPEDAVAAAERHHPPVASEG